MITSVVIPCYKVKKHILNVIERIGPEVQHIYVIDDKCPEATGEYIKKFCHDPRVKVIFNKVNLGVGGAVKNGYKHAFDDNCDIAVKVDGDGQMNPELIPHFIKPIINGDADYTKGNRFFDIQGLRKMPAVRIFGNAALSFITKMSCGYWNIMDPTNGYTAINLQLLPLIPLTKVENRYFFESDILFRLNITKAKVVDIPMIAVYEDEESNLAINKILFSFSYLHLNRLFKRIFYSYFLRDFNLGSIGLVTGSFSILFGSLYGSYNWIIAGITQTPTPTGVIMLSTLPIILGLQLFIFFLQIDISSIPHVPLSQKSSH